MSAREPREILVQDIRETEAGREPRWLRSNRSGRHGKGPCKGPCPGRFLHYCIVSQYDRSAASLVKLWKSGEAARALCSRRQSLEHFLPACNLSLRQGCFTWRQNKVLTELAAVVDVARLEANKTAKTKPGP